MKRIEGLLYWALGLGLMAPFATTVVVVALPWIDVTRGSAAANVVSLGITGLFACGILVLARRWWKLGWRGMGLACSLAILALLTVAAIWGVAALDTLVTLMFWPYVTLSGLLLPALTVWLLRDLRKAPRAAWTLLGGAWAAAGTLAFHLVQDDATVDNDLNRNDLYARTPEVRKAYETLMGLSTSSPYGHIDARVPRTEPFFPPTIKFRGEEQDYSAWLLSNAETVNANWEKLVAARKWMDDVNALERFNDIAPEGLVLGHHIISFSHLRYLAHAVDGRARLLALEDRGDEAAETVARFISMSHRLAGESRSLVHIMMGNVCLKMSAGTADFVLRHAEMSPSSRARLGAALEASYDPESIVERLVEGQYVYFKEALDGIGDPGRGEFAALLQVLWGRPVMDYQRASELKNAPYGGGLALIWKFTEPFLLNKKDTLNRYNKHVERMTVLATDRDYTGLEKYHKVLRESEKGPHLKNYVGRRLIGDGMPAYHLLLEMYWEQQKTMMDLAERARETA